MVQWNMCYFCYDSQSLEVRRDFHLVSSFINENLQQCIQFDYLGS